MRGWPVTLTEPDLLDLPVGLRPVRVKDAATWRETRVRNAAWLRAWEPTNPETPLYRSSLGPYVSMARTMRREARQGLTVPWVVTYGGRFAGQLTVAAGEYAAAGEEDENSSAMIRQLRVATAALNAALAAIQVVPRAPVLPPVLPVGAAAPRK